MRLAFHRGTMARIPCFLTAALFVVPPAAGTEGAIDYLKDVKPILATRCGTCHGALKRKGGLRLDTAALARRGGESGPGLIPGKPDESPIFRAITGADGRTMPPEGDPLSVDEVGTLRRWIEEGAVAPEEPTPPDPRDHWAFSPPKRPPVPVVQDGASVRNPIDAFIAREREQRGLAAVPMAEKHVLLRRVYLDLIGLPPTRAEMEAFLADPAPDAYEKIVDQLLASPRHGERWGRHWMDVWRYSDWAGWGMQVRDSLPHIWHWRDWIIESVNEDKPYDRILMEMLAADELAPGDQQSLRATGFLARQYKLLSRETWMQETVEHTAKAFLGLTLACARCHDHMTDPIAQEEYYRFRAIFEPYSARSDRLPGFPDSSKNSLPRAFDSEPNQLTYLFVRGDDRQPVKDRPIPPGVPAVLGGPSYEAKPVPLPLTAYIPEMAEYVRTETLEASRQAIEEARARIDPAREQLAQATTTVQAAIDEETKIRAERAGAGDGSAEAAAAKVQAALTRLEEAQRGLTVTLRAVDAAAARAIALERTIEVERIGDDVLATASADPAAADLECRKLKQTDTWRELARRANEAQRDAAVKEALRDQLQAERALAEAKAEEVKATDADKAKELVEKRTKELAETEARLAAGREKLQLPLDENYEPRKLATYPATSSGRRLALVRWLVSDANPLTARVAANQIWLRHFGRGLVETPFNLGVSGALPTHPELLDWLALELMHPSLALGDRTKWSPIPAPWSMKHLHRLIVTSGTYRMASTPDERCLAADPDNRLYWRMPSRRMEAEVVRDSVLYVGGRLDLTLGGPDLDHALGQQVPRRSLYFRHAAEKQMEFLKLFDAAAVTECYERKESIVPQQALALVNSELALSQARALARALSDEDAADARGFVVKAFAQVLSRPVKDEEARLCLDYLDEQARFFTEKKDALKDLAADRADLAHPAAEPALRAREGLVHVLLNHNDFVTIR